MAKETLTLPSDPAKRPDALATALCDAIEEQAVDDPGGARAAVLRAREALDEAEGAAIRAALARFNWRLAPAAALLGFPRHSALQKLVEKGRRHEAIGREIERHRDALDYHGGRPPKALIEPPPEGQKSPRRRGKNAPHG